MKIGVALLAYNCSKYIEEAIDSVINQTYKDWVLLIFNNNSDIETTIAINKKLDKCFEQDIALKSKTWVVTAHDMFHSEAPILYEPLPTGFARWLSVKLLIAQYPEVTHIALLDGDDIWLNHKLDVQVESILDSPETVGLHFSDCYYGKMVTKQIENYPAFMEEMEIGTKTFLERHKKPPFELFEHLIYKENIIPCCTIIIEKGAFLRVAKSPSWYYGAEDYEWVVRLAKLYPCLCVYEPLAIWRRHPNQLTKRKRISCSLEEVDVVIREAMDTLSEDRRGLVWAKLSLVQHLVWLYFKLAIKTVLEIVRV